MLDLFSTLAVQYASPILEHGELNYGSALYPLIFYNISSRSFRDESATEISSHMDIARMIFKLLGIQEQVL